MKQVKNGKNRKYNIVVYANSVNAMIRSAMLELECDMYAASVRFAWINIYMNEEIEDKKLLSKQWAIDYVQNHNLIDMLENR